MTSKLQEQNAQAMGLDPKPVFQGMDILIISTNTPSQQAYWAERLEATRGQICREDAKIYVTYEDWPGGAGNGLGSLYAFQKACQLALRDGVDLLGALESGASIALYHTAGKGTRLAPLPGSEYNNKSAVKLPSLISIDGELQAITMLEAIIRQTSVYAESRKGRLSVFWGDQLFVPSTPIAYFPRYHVDLLAKMRPIPNQEEWLEGGLQGYGILTVGADGSAQLAEKLSFDQFSGLLQTGGLHAEESFGISLGCFSLSAPMTLALLKEFHTELRAKQIGMGSDIDFWMPLTLDEPTFLQIGGDGATKGHHERMQKLAQSVLEQDSSLQLFGPVDLGCDCYWWDFGQVKAYLTNNLKLLQRDGEGHLLRTLFGVAFTQSNEGEVDQDENSCLIHCRIKEGCIRNSLLLGVEAEHLDVEDSVIINTAAPNVEAHHALLYNVVETKKLSAPDGCVRADVFLPESRHHFKLWTHMERDGRKDWEERIFSNPVTFADLHRLNVHVDLGKAHRLAERIRKKVLGSRL